MIKVILIVIFLLMRAESQFLSHAGYQVERPNPLVQDNQEFAQTFESRQIQPTSPQPSQKSANVQQRSAFQTSDNQNTNQNQNFFFRTPPGFSPNSGVSNQNVDFQQLDQGSSSGQILTVPQFLDQSQLALIQGTFPIPNRCFHPRILIGGICQCPNSGRFINGICIPQFNPCPPPRTIINGQCRCPNNLVFTTSGNCVNPNNNNNNPYTGGGTSTNCPSNGIIVAGQCFIRDDDLPFLTQNIGPISDVNSICGLALIYRNYDGANNNQNNRLWGSKGSILQRRAPNGYKDGNSQVVTHLPNPRQNSNKVGKIDNTIERSRNHITTAFVIWGQFFDHDIDLTKQGNQPFNIPIPSFDTFFSGQSFLNFKRSHFVQGSSPRQHRNTITSWIDGSQIYGSDETLARSLRSFQNGKLKVSSGNLLPKNDDGLFSAGDERVNENFFLTSYHTIFMREHNRQCDRLKSKDQSLNDEQIYQAARNYVIGLVQKITMDDFLPLLLGSQYHNVIGSYSGYKPFLNPNIPIEFSTAAFRVGHSLLVDVFPLINRNGIEVGEFHLRDLFFRPDLFSSFSSTMENAMRGLSKNLMKEKNVKLADSVRNLLVESPDNRQVKLDLYALNIQRGSDHGLPTYNNVRRAVGLPAYSSFAQLVADTETIHKLGELYGSIENLDLIVGIFAEDSVPGGVLGELGAKIVGETFRNLRDGDRFWYEGAYPHNIVNEIKSLSFSDIIRRNTGIGFGQINSNVFKL